MATLVTLQGPNPGRHFRLGDGASLIGRQPTAAVYLDSLAVSRQHARVVQADEVYFVEDLGSSNGTFLNGRRIEGRVPLTENDTLQVGPYVLGLRPEPPPFKTGPDQIIRTQVAATPANHTLYLQNPAYKLQVVLEIAQTLARTLELEPLLGKLLDHLLRLFPQADRGLVLLCEGDRLMLRALRGRRADAGDSAPYSRTVVRRALEEGVGILSQDVTGDPKLVLSQTLMNLNLRSFLCVPLIAPDGHRQGVIQLDGSTPGLSFKDEDLEVLTALSLQVSVVLENAALHAARIEEEKLRQELAVAREIQQGYLPTDFALLGGTDFELFARVHPAREVSGDLYDFFPLSDGRLAFFVGDVSGKGMPAALFLVAVRTLARYLAPAAAGPADALSQLNDALAVDNPSAMFVTMVHGIYDPRSGALVLASGGHPRPLLRRADGRVEEVALRNGRLLGYAPGGVGLSDAALTLAPGETLVLYTDGYTEARAPDGVTMFGAGRLAEALGVARTALPLERCAEELKAAVERFTGTPDLQDDQTLLMLRRR
jgi:sigma-B regulation protein RsbU (phosphoserine phosphatase)